MRILILTQYFAPEITAATARLRPIARHMAELGHEVEVVCEVPNHPEGVVHEGFRRAVVSREMDGFSVRYVWVSASPVKTTWSRLRFYGSYALMASLVGSLGPRPDVIFVSSPPLPAAAAAAVVAKRFRIPWVIDVRDPWPEAAVALGELSNPRVIRLLERLERWLYASATAIVTVTESFRTDILAKVDDPSKISIVPNGTTREWLRAGEREEDRLELGLPEDRFVWTYAGNLGLAQGLDAAVEAAERLGDGFQLLLVGDGPERTKLEDRASRLPGETVAFKGLVEPELAARYLRASDAALVSLGNQPELAKFVPSKLFDCCAIGRPVILAAAGEALRLVVQAEAALPIPPADPAALADAVRALRDDATARQRLGEAGRAFAAQHLRELQLERLEGLLREVAQAGRLRDG